MSPVRLATLKNARRALVLGVLLAMALPLGAQRGRGRGFGGFGFSLGLPSPLPYDGRFTIVRLWYPYYGGWAFDWPEMEENFSQILQHITAMRMGPNGHSILRMDDPELLKFPVAYLSEPGYWHPSDAEVLGLREYITKGGFLIVDDFHFQEEWNVFEDAMLRVLPGARIERLDLSHPVFNSFFEIKSLDVPYPGRLGEMGLKGEFYGIHDESHPSLRLMVVINYNMDIGDYMEWSATGWYAVAPTNEAYKFAINYVIYGLTH